MSSAVQVLQRQGLLGRHDPARSNPTGLKRMREGKHPISGRKFDKVHRLTAVCQSGLGLATLLGDDGEAGHLLVGVEWLAKGPDIT